MECYTFVHGECSKGIQVVQHEKYGQIVFLGQQGRGSRFAAISLDDRRPANIHEGYLHRAFPREITIKEKESGEVKSKFTVLSKPFRKNRKILLRVNTTMPERKTATDGRWIPWEGEPKAIVEAHGCEDPRGVSVQYCDDLIVMDPTDVIRVMPMGGSQVDVRMIMIKIVKDEHNKKHAKPVAMTEEEFMEWEYENERQAEAVERRKKKEEVPENV